MTKKAMELVELLKEAGVGDVARKAVGGVGDLVSGAYRTVGAGTRAAGEEASKRLGGGAKGLAAEKAIRALPWVAGGYGANVALGDPVGQRYEEEKQRLRARLAATRSIWNPHRNMMV